jgi:hypothetical protein
MVHRPCTVGAVGRANAAEVEWHFAFATEIYICVVHWPCTIGAVRQTNAENVELRLEFAEVIIAW